MADAGEKEIRKKDREPITMVCFVVLVAACIAVLGIYVYDHYVEDHTEYVEYGDTIDVDYVGSLYGYYNTSNANIVPLIFDTSIESVANNSNNHFTFDYTKATSFSASEITIGDRDFLAAIEDALIGKAVGSTVYVKVPAADAYPQGNNNVTVDQSSNHLYFVNNKEMSTTEFKSFFDVDAPTTSEPSKTFDFDGFDVTATLTSSGSVCVNYNVTVGTKVTLDANTVDSVFGTVTIEIVSISDSKVYYTITITDAKTTGSKAYGTDIAEIEMITLDVFPGFHMNIVGYDSNGIVYNQSTSDESYASTHNMTLYFVVTIVSKD